MPLKQYFVPKESHTRTLRGLTSVVGTQPRHLFRQKPALPVNKSFSLAAQRVSVLSMLECWDPVGPLLPSLLFLTSLLLTRIQVEPPCKYQNQKTNKQTKQLQSKSQISKSQGLEILSLLSGWICILVYSGLGGKLIWMHVSCLYCLTVLCKPVGRSWWVSRSELGAPVLIPWLEFEKVGTLRRDLGAPACNSCSEVRNLHFLSVNILSWNWEMGTMSL